MDEDDVQEVVFCVAPRRWSWWLVGSMAVQRVGEVLVDVALAMVAHAQYELDRAEMAEQGALEIEQLTTGGTV